MMTSDEFEYALSRAASMDARCKLIEARDREIRASALREAAELINGAAEGDADYAVFLLRGLIDDAERGE